MFYSKKEAVYNDWYTTLVKGLVETSRFVNSICFSGGWSAISLTLTHIFYLPLVFKSGNARKRPDKKGKFERNGNLEKINKRNMIQSIHIKLKANNYEQ